MDEDYPRFSPTEYARRHALVRQALETWGLDALLIYGGFKDTKQQNVRWLSNYADHTYCYVVFPLEAEPTLFNAFPGHYATAVAMSVLPDTRFGGLDIADKVVERLRELRLEAARIGLVGVSSLHAATLPVNHYETFCRACPAARFRDVTAAFERLRWARSAEELTWLRRGAALTDAAMAALADVLRPGVSEHELFGALIEGGHAEGGNLVLGMIGSTPMTAPALATPWPAPSDRRVGAGDLVLARVAVTYYGYSGYLARSFALGDPPDVYAALYQAARQAHAALLTTLQPGRGPTDLLDGLEAAGVKELRTVAPLAIGWDGDEAAPVIWPRGHPAVGGGDATGRWGAGRAAGAPGDEASRAEPLEAGQILALQPNPCTPDERSGVILGDLWLLGDGEAVGLQRFPQGETIPVVG